MPTMECLLGNYYLSQDEMPYKKHGGPDAGSLPTSFEDKDKH